MSGMNSAMKRWVRRVHRVSAYIVGIQVLLWIAGGLTFAWVPFESVIKGGASVLDVAPVALPADWAQQLAQTQEALGETTALSSYPSAQGPLLELVNSDGKHWLRLEDGALDPLVTAVQVARFADTLYVGDGSPEIPRYIEVVERRVLGLVDELYGRSGVWQVAFDDGANTRLYFEGDTGRYLTVRNDFWVLYDAMWRLHIMDYRGGEDFNNLLLTVSATMAAVFVLSGLVLMGLALTRLLRSVSG